MMNLFYGQYSMQMTSFTDIMSTAARAYHKLTSSKIWYKFMHVSATFARTFKNTNDQSNCTGYMHASLLCRIQLRLIWRKGTINKSSLRKHDTGPRNLCKLLVPDSSVSVSAIRLEPSYRQPQPLHSARSPVN